MVTLKIFEVSPTFGVLTETFKPTIWGEDGQLLRGEDGQLIPKTAEIYAACSASKAFIQIQNDAASKLRMVLNTSLGAITGVVSHPATATGQIRPPGKTQSHKAISIVYRTRTKYSNIRDITWLYKLCRKILTCVAWNLGSYALAALSPFVLKEHSVIERSFKYVHRKQPLWGNKLKQCYQMKVVRYVHLKAGLAS